MGETTDEVRLGQQSSGIAVEKPALGLSAQADNQPGEEAEALEATEIRSDIEQTRSSMSATVEALQEKLDPGRIAEQVKDQIRGKASDAYDSAKHAVKEATIRKAAKIVSSVSDVVTDATGRAGEVVSGKGLSAVQYVRDNPVPFALLGIGFGMLAMNKRQTQSGSYSSGSAASSLSDRARNVTSGAADTFSNAAGTVRDTASSVTESAREQLRSASEGARQGSKYASDRVQSALQENPLALGIAALAAGALVGLSLPATRVESEYLGEARDRFIDQAKSLAQDAAGNVQRIAEEASHSLKHAAQKEGLVNG